MGGWCGVSVGVGVGVSVEYRPRWPLRAFIAARSAAARCAEFSILVPPAAAAADRSRGRSLVRSTADRPVPRAPDRRSFTRGGLALPWSIIRSVGRSIARRSLGRSHRCSPAAACV